MLYAATLLIKSQFIIHVLLQEAEKLYTGPLHIAHDVFKILH